MTRPAPEQMGPSASLKRVDPHNINARLENQTSRLLRLMEEMPDESIEIKAFYMTLIAIWRMRAVGVALRKEKIDEPSRGSAVRKYAAAFKTDGPRGRAAVARKPEPEPDTEPDIESLLDGDDDIA